RAPVERINLAIARAHTCEFLDRAGGERQSQPVAADIDCDVVFGISTDVDRRFSEWVHDDANLGDHLQRVAVYFIRAGVRLGELFVERLSNVERLLDEPSAPEQEQ